MELLPVLVDHPLRHGAGTMHLLVPGRAPILLVNGQEPVARFNQGWHAEQLFTLFDPLWILVLRHETGEVACWYVDSTGALAAAPQHRGAAERREMSTRLQEVAVWVRTAPGAGIRLAVPETVLAYVRLPLTVQRDLDALLDAPLASGLPEEEARRAGLASEAPPLMFQPIEGTRRTLIGNPGRLVPLGAGELQPGWRVIAIETVFAPLLSVILRHEAGHQAVWFVDPDGRLVANQTDQLPPMFADHVVQKASRLFESLWHRIALGEDVDPVQAPDVIGTLPPAALSGLAPAYLRRLGQDFDTRLWALDEALPSGMGYAVPTRDGLCVFDQVLVARGLAHRLQGEMDRLLRTGRMCWPSPLDGSLVESDGFALLIDRNCFAYRFRQQAAGLVFYVICSGGYFRNYGLYFPTADLMVSATRVPGGDFVLLGRARETILRHLLHFGGALTEGGQMARDPVVQLVYGACAIHIGHYVWQDLAGLAYLLNGLGSAPPPALQMFEVGRTTQFFGAEEELFPVLDGRITRHAGAFGEHVESFYRHNQRVITYTAISVPASLGEAVRKAARLRPELQADRRAADAAAARGPVVLIGIRVGNRTMPDQQDVLAALIRRLGRDVPRCTVVLDGLNDPLDRGGSVAPELATGSELAQELVIGRGLARVADEAGLQFVDLVNRSALCSVLWCSQADMFVAPLGAALAKYRWICNTPGLVLSSRWNLQNRGDLRIYDAPAALENSSEMAFVPLEHVRDDAPAHEPGRTGFFIDRDPVFAQIADMIRRQSSARLPVRAALSGSRAVPWPSASVPHQPTHPTAARASSVASSRR